MRDAKAPHFPGGEFTTRSAMEIATLEGKDPTHLPDVDSLFRVVVRESG